MFLLLVHATVTVATAQVRPDDGDVEEPSAKEIKRETQVEKVTVKRKTNDEFLQDSPQMEEKAERFKCFYCTKDFSMEQSRKRHVRQSHKELFKNYVEKIKASDSM